MNLWFHFEVDNAFHYICIVQNLEKVPGKSTGGGLVLEIFSLRVIQKGIKKKWFQAELYKAQRVQIKLSSPPLSGREAQLKLMVIPELELSVKLRVS